MQGVLARNHLPMWFRNWRTRLAGLVCLAAVIAVASACIAQEGKPQETPAAGTAQISDSKVSPVKDSKPQKGAAADSERKKLIADQSAQLLQMALALKAEVDKTTKDTLSLNVIKKADEIEKLAKSVKEKMKQNSGS